MQGGFLVPDPKTLKHPVALPCALKMARFRGVGHVLSPDAVVNGLHSSQFDDSGEFRFLQKAELGNVCCISRFASISEALH
jgi:hypothetical protein